MNTKWIFVLLFLLKGQISYQQQDPIVDSLISVVQNASEDTAKVVLLNTLGRKLYELDRYDEAKDYLSQALALSEKLHYDGGIVKTYHRMGGLYRRMGDDSAAVSNYLRAMDLATETGDEQALVYINSGLGLLYDYDGKYPEAMTHYVASLNIAEKIGDTFSIGAAHQNLGCLYMYWLDYEKALKHSLEALAVWKRIGHKGNMADAYANIGESYLNLGNVDEGEKYTLLAMELAREIGQNHALGAAYVKLGLIYGMKADPHKALNSYKQSLEVWEIVGDKLKITESVIFIGKGYTALGNHSEAIKYYNKGLSLAQEIDSKINVADTYKFLSEAHASLGNYHEALDNYKLHISAQDAILSYDHLQEIEALKEQYASEKKDIEIALLNEEKQTQALALTKERQRKNYVIAGLALLVILFILGYRQYHTRQQLKLLSLRNKIASDLHDDVGSTLSSIYMFSEIARQQSKETIPALETIAESSKTMLDSMTDIVWTINPQNDQFEKIIMRMRSFAFELLGSKQIDFEFKVDEEIPKLKLPMEARKNLYLIFKESINNMVKYAQADKAMLELKGHQDHLTMMIRDNGKGFDASREFEGNGLKNMRKRAADVGARLNIDSDPGSGTTIKVELAI